MSRDWLNLTWREKTAGERAQTALSFAIASVMCLGLFGGGLMALGVTLEGITRYKSEHNQCLQKATNGYEIKQC